MADEKKEADKKEGPLTWATELIERLEKAYCGKDIIRVILDAQYTLFTAEKHSEKPPDHPARHLTAMGAVAALDKVSQVDPLRVPPQTVEKARQFVENGVYVPPPRPVDHPAKLLPPPPQGPLLSATKLEDEDEELPKDVKIPPPPLGLKPTDKPTDVNKPGRKARVTVGADVKTPAVTPPDSAKTNLVPGVNAPGVYEGGPVSPIPAGAGPGVYGAQSPNQGS